MDTAMLWFAVGSAFAGVADAQRKAGMPPIFALPFAFACSVRGMWVLHHVLHP